MYNMEMELHRLKRLFGASIFPENGTATTLTLKILVSRVIYFCVHTMIILSF